MAIWCQSLAKQTFEISPSLPVEKVRVPVHFGSSQMSAVSFLRREFWLRLLFRHVPRPSLPKRALKKPCTNQFESGGTAQFFRYSVFMIHWSSPTVSDFLLVSGHQMLQKKRVKDGFSRILVEIGGFFQNFIGVLPTSRST